MSLSDSIFIFVLALIIFGPKKLPGMAKQLGKLLGEFRRASNEFKFQIEDELRQSDLQDRQKSAPSASSSSAPEPTILPPTLHSPLLATTDENAAEITPLPTPTPTLPSIVAAAGAEPRGSSSVENLSAPEVESTHG